MISVYQHSVIFGFLFGLVALSFTAVIHEFGHWSVARAIGMPAQMRAKWQRGVDRAGVPWPTLMWVHIDDAAVAQLTPMGKFLCAIAGPVSNLLVAVAVRPWLRFDIEYDRYLMFVDGNFAMPVDAWLAMTMFYFNMAFFVINVAPFGLLDGGRCISAIRESLKRRT